MITVSNALFSLTPDAQWTISNNNYDTVIWHTPEIVQPTKAAVDAEVARLTEEIPFKACSDQAKKLLADSDWSMLSDVNISNRAEFETYRAALRTLVFNPVADPTFPTEPQPIWV
jgi:hypothetical protein